ncbi:hypothetical protein Dimus_006361 [Dionaea muscipula]
MGCFNVDGGLMSCTLACIKCCLDFTLAVLAIGWKIDDYMVMGLLLAVLEIANCMLHVHGPIRSSSWAAVAAYCTACFMSVDGRRICFHIIHTPGLQMLHDAKLIIAYLAPRCKLLLHSYFK